MAPTDGANLLLALMYDDGHEAAPVNVPRLRAAELIGIEGKPHGGGAALQSMPPHDFLSEDGAPRPLGDVLDAMLDIQTLYGTLDKEPADDTPGRSWTYAKNVQLSISRPGYAARLWVDAVAVHWTLTYRWRDPEDAARRAAEVAANELPRHELVVRFAHGACLRLLGLFTIVTLRKLKAMKGGNDAAMPRA